MIIFLTTILIMSLFCIGINLLMQEGQLLSFMREPIEKKIKDIEKLYDQVRYEINITLSKRKSEINRESCSESCDPEKMFKDGWSQERVGKEFEYARQAHELNTKNANTGEKLELRKLFWLKPFVLCVWCFASFWGSLIFWAFHLFIYHDYSNKLFILWPVSCVICVVFNAVFDSVLRKLNVYE